MTTKRTKSDTPRMPDAPPEDLHNRCVADGCPLRATIFDATVNIQILRSQGRDRGRCRYHDAAKPSDWPYLTEIFNTHRWTRAEIEPALAQIGLHWREDYGSDHYRERREERDAIQRQDDPL